GSPRRPRRPASPGTPPQARSGHGAGPGGRGRPAQEMKNYILDMDGVIYRGNQLIPAAREFIERLQQGGHRFLFLTNNSKNTPRDFQRKLERMGLEVPEEHYFTSAMATAAFLHSQKPGGSAFVIGEAGLSHALYQVGYSI